MFSMLVVGNVDDCRTEVGISAGTGNLVAILYKDSSGGCTPTELVRMHQRV